MKIGILDPLKRQQDKQEARIMDQRQLDAGEITAEELQKRNNFFEALDFTNAVISFRRTKLR